MGNAAEIDGNHCTVRVKVAEWVTEVLPETTFAFTVTVELPTGVPCSLGALDPPPQAARPVMAPNPSDATTTVIHFVRLRGRVTITQTAAKRPTRPTLRFSASEGAAVVPTVTVTVPACPAVRLSVAGVKEHVAPEGSPVQSNVALPPRLAFGVRVSVSVFDCPFSTVNVAEL